MSGASCPAEKVSEALKRAVVEHYEASLRRFGPTARGMDWKDEASQELRFEVLCDGLERSRLSIAEVGCGAGHLVDFLRRRGIRGSYAGYDLSPAMVEAARARHPGVVFACHDLLHEPLPERYDLVLCSGVFHVKLDRSEEEWRSFVRAMIRRMYQSCRRSIAFNLMSDQVDYRNPDLFYSSAAETLSFCQRELSRNVRLCHDYPLYEYTVHVHRELPS